MYAKFIKRWLDFLLSLSTIIMISPLLLILSILGVVMMRGNPFFVQRRPGKDGTIFHLIKFRTMSNVKDADGKFLPDEKRLNKYGRWLRKASLDELPELFNVLVGQMSLVGPRPLLEEYLPYYSEEERHRHDVLPGVTGISQVNGRNRVDWSERFQMDVYYAQHVNFILDIKIILKTIKKVLFREDVLENTAQGETNFAEEREAGRI